MKRFISVLSICLIWLCSVTAVWADNSSSVKAKVDFDKSTVTVTVQSPARYGQHILVTLYPTGSSLDDPTQYVRIGEMFADRDGRAELLLKLDGVAPGHYTVSATGGGYLAESSHNTTNIYFETTDDLNNITLPAVSTATGETLDTQLTKLQTWFGIDLGSGYIKDPDFFLTCFEAVRAEDYASSLDTMGKVQETADRVNLIMTTLQAKTQADIKALYESQATALDFDKTKADYSENKPALYNIYLKLVDKQRDTIKKMGDLRILFRRATGMAVINTKNAETVTDVIVAYGDAFGIPVDSYNTYCSTYGAVNMNMDFIGRNFSDPTDVLSAYQAAVTAVTASSGAASGGSSTSGGSLSSAGNKGSSRVPNVISTGSAAPTEPKETAFSDVSTEHWGYEAIMALSAKGIINGFDDGSFQPDIAVTREQFVKMLVSAFLSAEAATTTRHFVDVPSGHWAEAAIQAAVSADLISGISETEFGLTTALTRQDAAVIIDRVLTRLQKNTSLSEAVQFSDSDQIADYATDSVTRLCATGILGGMGDGTFAPAAGLTRAQAAKILYGVLSLQ